MALPEAGRSGVIAVERDPGVVEYLRDLHPEDNQHIFREVETVIGDGRQFIERQQVPLAAVVIESARFQPAHSLLPASAPTFLYTREAVAAYVGRLAPDGFFVAGFTGVGTRAKMEYLPLQVANALRGLGLEVTSVMDKFGDVHVIGCRSPACTARVLSSELLRVRGQWTPRTVRAPMHARTLTDSTPFAGWAMMYVVDQHILLVVAALLAAGCLAAGRGMWRVVHSLRGWNPIPYFVAIGVGHSVLLVGSCYAWRTYYTDDVLTVVRVLAWLITFGAVGAAVADRLRGRFGGGTVAAFGVGLLVLHVALWSVIPFGEASVPVRELVGALLLLPGGFAMGLFFPLGLGLAPAPKVGAAILADAAGTLLGYCCLTLVAIPFGLGAFAALGLACYAAAAFAAQRGFGRFGA